MAAYIERLKSPIGEALWAAGPPSGQILGALGLAVVLTAALSLADALFGPPWFTLALIGLLLTGVVSVIDRDGWRIRVAFAYLALQQRARWRQREVPEGTEEIEAWLDDPANIGASNLERATMLFNADRWEEADRLLAQTAPRDDKERAVLIRLSSTVAAQIFRRDRPNRAARCGLESSRRGGQIPPPFSHMVAGLVGRDGR